MMILLFIYLIPTIYFSYQSLELTKILFINITSPSQPFRDVLNFEMWSCDYISVLLTL